MKITFHRIEMHWSFFLFHNLLMGFKGTKLYCFILNVVDRLSEIDAGFKDMKPGGWRWYEEGNSGQTQIL